MARAYVTWKSTRCLSLSSGAKLAKYENRVAFELGLGTCSPDVWALSADVWAFLVTASASFSESLLKMSFRVGSFCNWFSRKKLKKK